MSKHEALDEARAMFDLWRAQSAVAHELLDKAGVGDVGAGLHIRVAALIRRCAAWEKRARELESLCADRL